MIRTLAAMAAAVLFLGGGTLVLLGLRQARGRGVERLRRAIGDATERDIDSERPGLAALWSQLTRAADDASRGSSLHLRLGGLAERAGWLLRPAEFLILVAGAALIGGLTGLLLGNPILAVALGSGAPLATMGVASRAANRRTDRVDGQLPDVLDQLASSMRSGHSLTQAIEAVAESGAAPLGPELERVIAETQVGRPLDEALQAMATRLDSIDLRWTVRAMVIQARTGGTLSDLLDVLAEFMRDREEVRREVKALTADGRISALVLSALPFLLLGAMLAIRADYLQPLITEPIGRAMSVVSAGALAMGLLWIRKIVRIEV